jgi:hypothetical protein
MFPNFPSLTKPGFTLVEKTAEYGKLKIPVSILSTENHYLS